MKKILAFVLALCLTLSLTVVAFAAPNSPTGGAPVGSTGSASYTGSAGVSKYTFNATTASGLPLSASVDTLSSGAVYDEIKTAGVIGLYYISINSAVADTEMVNIDVYAPGASASSVVIVRDGWEVLPNVSVVVNGDRATISAPAGVLNQWHYIAIVDKWDVTDVKNPQQGTENEEESENVDDGDAPEVDAEEDTETTPEPEAQAPAAEEKNPGTGVALAVIPMIVSAAAAVISKRR